MTREYDDGSVSGAIRDRFLAKVRDRMEAAGMVKQDEPSIEELMASFMSRVSKTRSKAELMRVTVRGGMVPDDNGLPERGSLMEVLPSFFVQGLRRLWEDSFDRTGAQQRASVALGDAIDKAIRGSGGSTSAIDAMVKEHATLYDIEHVVTELREAVAYVPFAVGFNNLTVAGQTGKFANSSNAQKAINAVERLYNEASELLEAAPGLARKFPEIAVAKVGLFSLMAAPVTTEANLSAQQAKDMLPLIIEFQESFDKWDVMDAYHQIWQDRATVCRTVGLTQEAEICTQVAEQYDRQYFEGLDKAWGLDDMSIRL